MRLRVHGFTLRVHEGGGCESASFNYKTSRRDLNRQLCFVRSPHPQAEEMVVDSAEKEGSRVHFDLRPISEAISSPEIKLSTEFRKSRERLRRGGTRQGGG